MQLKHAFIALAFLPLLGCASKEGRTIEIPDGPEGARTERGHRSERTKQAAEPGERRGWFSRLNDGDTPNAGPCPLMGVLYDSSRLVEFDGGQERYANIRFTGEMRGVRGFCRYIGSDPIEMNLEIDMAFGRGPAAGDARSRVYRYWVAVARRGRAPIEKQFYDIEVEFDRREAVVDGTEEIRRIIIPRANNEVSGDNFEILVGFELTPQQLQFNRDGKRFRIDAAAPG
jgi:hypothetical protein